MEPIVLPGLFLSLTELDTAIYLKILLKLKAANEQREHNT
jgi:hypothetical protein